MRAGTTLAQYAERAPTNVDGYDPVDEIVLKTAANVLKLRLLKVFGLLYYRDFSYEEIASTLKDNFGIEMSRQTIERYKNRARSDMLTIISRSSEIMNEIRSAVMH